jgi:hypothetical protein
MGRLATIRIVVRNKIHHGGATPLTPRTWQNTDAEKASPLHFRLFPRHR